MGKSRAEVQRAYRQRLKERNNEAYLQKERERMRRNYVPSSALSENDREKRNAKNREKLRKLYRRKREERAALQAQQSINAETSGYESEPSSSQDRGRLRIRMPFTNNRRNGAIKRWRRELSDARCNIRMLEQERDKAITKYRSAQRSLQRFRNKQKPDTCSTEEMTPRKQTMQLMKEADLSADQRKKLKKPLLLGNVVCNEIKSTKAETKTGQRKAIHRIVSGRIMKKYRCIAQLAKKTGLCRHKLGQNESKDHQLKISCRHSTVKRHQAIVEKFMKREDNSRQQPGKNDTKRIKKGEKIQTHVLTDYLSNLYSKFKSENSEVKMSFTSFCRARPKYILTAAFSSRSSCLCTKHQNASLTVKALRRVGIDVSQNPEKAIGQIPDEEAIVTAVGTHVMLKQWTRVEVEERGKKKIVTKMVDSELEAEKFASHVKKQMYEFEGHVNRVHTQFEQIRELKEKLPDHEMILQLDFAENYSCKSLEEVQSAYFNMTMVTLHPVVAYFRNDGILQHKSFIIISDEMAHRPSTVIAFINEIMPYLKQMDSNLRRIHYWSDSPSSQYRNKNMFNFVSNHIDRYGVHARWNYFEAGHGKGPCDGLGGSCKRLADEAMRSGKVIIQDPKGFYEWATTSSMRNVKFLFVTTTTCGEVEKELAQSPVKPIKGTMKIHAVEGKGASELLVRDVSCYCENCLSGETCTTWRHETLKTSTKRKDGIRKENINTEKTEKKESPSTVCVNTDSQETIDIAHDNVEKESSSSMIGNDLKVETGSYVAAVYEKTWYVGKVEDCEDDEIEINFMVTKKLYFQWPVDEDKLWINVKDILCKIEPPQATGKSMRMFKITANDRQNIIACFAKHCDQN